MSFGDLLEISSHDSDRATQAIAQLMTDTEQILILRL
jgi:hypothetical protein